MRHLVLLVLLVAATADARAVRGLVFVDDNGDGLPSRGERGVPGAVVAYEVHQFVLTNARGEYEVEVPDGASGNVWVRVPEGYRPGPVWGRATGDRVDLPLRPFVASPGPLTFVVAADTHLAPQEPFWADLPKVVRDATALDPAPSFVTILGDITQGNLDTHFDLVDAALAGVPVPYVPVPGNHDWYDGGATWFRRYGPDNYSFDVGGVHVVVWNMAMPEQDVLNYLGAELERVPATMTIVALTHAPPTPRVVRVLEVLGVDYLLTGHTHSNRVVDHLGLVELTTEPLLMGGLDHTPAGYRIVTIDKGRASVVHHAVVEEPLLAVLAPRACAADQLLVATELDASATTVTATFDCGEPITLRAAGGWTWTAPLPSLGPGVHTATITARTASGRQVTRTHAFETCTPSPAPPIGAAWPQLGGGPAHRGAVVDELAPPLAPRWTAAAGGHLVTASPVVAHGVVLVATTDLARGDTGGVVALDLATGAARWKVITPRPIRGSLAVEGDTAVVAQIDGTVVGLDVATGKQRWRHELGEDIEARAAATFGGVTADAGEILVGNQRRLAAIDGRTGDESWLHDPARITEDFLSMSSVAVDEDIAVGAPGAFLGGLHGRDRTTGRLLWHQAGPHVHTVNASPVIANGLVYVANGATEVVASELQTGGYRWYTKLDPTGFDWGVATIGTPAIANGVLVVPTLWNALVGLDASSGRTLWTATARPSPLRTNHYRAAGEAGYAASPVITGDIVWAADTSGLLTARDLHTGTALWEHDLGVPVYGGLAVTGDWLIVTTFAGTVHAFARTRVERAAPVPRACTAPTRPRGCCSASPLDASPLLVVLYAAARRRRRRSARSARPTGASPPAPPALHL